MREDRTEDEGDEKRKRIEASFDEITKDERSVCEPCDPTTQCRQFSVKGKETSV